MVAVHLKSAVVSSLLDSTACRIPFTTALHHNNNNNARQREHDGTAPTGNPIKSKLIQHQQAGRAQNIDKHPRKTNS